MRQGRHAAAVFAALLACLVPAGSATAVQHHFFRLTVVDKTTSGPIAGIKLTTTNSIVFVTDGSGVVKFYEPGLMGLSVFFRLGACSIPVGQTQGTCGFGSGTTTTCTSNADCNLGYSPPLAFLGIPGSAFTANEQGNVTIRMCPSGATCTPDTVVGANAPSPAPLSTAMFKLTVVDQATGRGVPQMKVQTSTQTYITDSGGVVAYYDAARMGTTVHFDVSGNGYGTGAADLVASAGGSGQIAVARSDVAERLYRVTGGGVYHDTVLLELSAPTANPVLNAGVFGQDTAQTTVYQGKVFWIWGDTGQPSFPLGNFRATGATSLLPSGGGLDPSVGVNLTYFGDGGAFVKAMCPPANFPNPPGNTENLLCWMFDLLAAPNASGTERLFSRYTLVSGASGGVETGLGRFNDGTSQFDKFVTWPSGQRVLLVGHPIKIAHGSTTYAYYTSKGVSSFNTGLKPLDSLSRVVATETALGTPSGYQSYTPLVQSSDTQLDVNPDGTLHYTWKTDTKTLSGDNTTADAAAPADQKLYGHVQDPDSGAAPLISTTSTGWNVYRKRYAQIILQLFGTGSALGELWFAEADTPMGPWIYARKIVSHATDGYTFYNPRYHSFFDKQNGRDIFFEATYTTFITSLTPTPRDNYNQVMEHLDLATPAVVLPVPVYDLSQATTPGTFVTKSGLRTTTTDSTPVFMAPDRAGYAGTVPMYWSTAACLPRQLVVDGTPTTPVLFYALPANSSNPYTVPLYDYANTTTGAHAYSTNPSLVLAGFTRATDPIARVWNDPIHVNLPVSQYLPGLVADAGTDQCVQEHSPNAGASVTLDGTHTTAPTGVTVSYGWSFPGGSATGASPTVTLHAGLNVVTLTTTGSDGETSTATVLVNVNQCVSGCC